ncbi:MAG: metallopeptidase TldD-related protein [Actinomycetota bacterium]|nr:metallopeptidase TldD-related protein [Actinomycetota bacterium]
MISAQDLAEQALELSKADDCMVVVTERSEANLRWASNSLTTNGAMRSRRVAVISIVDGGNGAAAGTVSRSDSTDLAELVAASEQAARDAGPAEDAMPLIGEASGGGDWSAPPAVTGIDVFSTFAPDLGSAFGEATAGGRLLFGFAEHIVESTYLASSTGLRLRHDQPTGRLELNGKSPDFSRSVWAGAATQDFADISVASMTAEIATKLAWSERKIDLEPGRYETVLPPTTVADLMIYMYYTGQARDADEGQTVFSKKGGGNRIGEVLTEKALTMHSDPAAAGLQAAHHLFTTTSSPYASVFDNGLALPAVDWIRDGVLTNLIQTRAWAAKTGATPAPYVDNLIMEGPGGEGPSTQEMVASTERGLLLTTLWYIREVDPQTLLLTGLTRDGVFLVENGEVTGSVNNFRFNESPVDLLARVAEIGRTERCLPREWNDFFTRTAMPTLRIPDFNMSSVSPAS